MIFNGTEDFINHDICETVVHFFCNMVAAIEHDPLGINWRCATIDYDFTVLSHVGIDRGVFISSNATTEVLINSKQT